MSPNSLTASTIFNNGDSGAIVAINVAICIIVIIVANLQFTIVTTVANANLSA